MLDYFKGPPNFWQESQIEWNILRKIPLAEIKGTTWDPDSVMEYQFEAGLIEAPPKYQAGPRAQGRPVVCRQGLGGRVLPGRQGAGGQRRSRSGCRSCSSSRPARPATSTSRRTRTRTYNIGTFGTSDTVLVLFEVTPAGNVQIAGNDDSGTDLNARVSMRLQKGRHYQVGVRLYYADAALETSTDGLVIRGARLQSAADGPPRMVKWPTGSGGEPSSPNCVASAGGKARQPHIRGSRRTGLRGLQAPRPATQAPSLARSVSASATVLCSMFATW